MAELWSTERTALLNTLLDEKISINDIAAKLAMTPHAVRSKLRRMNATHKRIVANDASRCRWPIGDPADDDFHFCPATAGVGDSYCLEHQEVAYNRSSNHKRKLLA